MVLSESVGTKPMLISTQFCGILTFAIRSHPSVGVDAGKHLGENHQKLVIPAVYLKGGGKEERPPSRRPLGKKNWNVSRGPNCLDRCARGSFAVAMPLESHREFVGRSG